ncbi:type III secretion protein HrpB4 [Paraburkholderia nemoris]|uniref:Type III secretion protein HrpB4 n=1 Tax=Paraburkholderia nemoris TaxID=2793076 RepID=A0ABN7MWH2_9BURK|nr:MULTISPECIES: type III secretion protein HrpB4 [Paraburkholderia]KPD17832.1 hypothetical protein ADM96_16085 [Burkholderia sp. ST111]MBK3814667.1 hypothetical protein [Paraburkholderia aspalathi]CAE6816312.1 hypothetical protein R75777_05933 [Paraburkholderia nemoris]CAE6827142.1 hypothetical protein R69776_06428 [Paraburkholderia nemoris]
MSVGHAQASAAVMASGADVPDPQRQLRWLNSYEARIADAAARFSERQCRRWGVPFTGSARDAWYAARDLWLGTPMPVSAYASRANRLALLDAASLRPVLAARAIYPSRGTLRRIVSGARRRALADALGDHALAALMQFGVNASTANAPLPADLSVDALVCAGRTLFERADAWPLAPARRLIGLTLDDDAGETDPAARARPPEAAASDAGPEAEDESEAFLYAACTLFPELTWLFG